ncbi:MAG: metalloregulator ArsR/SmtB family transcription factor [Hyphomonadaceae bacterium]
MPQAPAKSRKKAPGRKTGGAPVEQLEPRAGEAARLLKLLASEQRLTVLCRLSAAEMSVGELGAHVKLSQSALSQHLAKLRADGLVATRRDAQTIYYRLADPAAERLIGVLCELYGGHAED